MMATINVLHNYGGRLTGEKRIEPGIYQDHDDALFGLAAYLVVNGHAVMVDGELPPPEVIDVPEDEEEELEFKGRTLKVKKAK